MCCAASGGSRAWSSLTTSAWRSCSASTTWSPTCPPPGGRRWRPASTSSCRSRLGGYSDVLASKVSVVDGIKSRVGDRVKVLYAEGCGLTQMNRGWQDDRVELPDPAKDAALVAEARKVAAEAEVVVLVLGQNEQ